MDIHFYGSSDDNFCVQTFEGERLVAEEIGCYNSAATYKITDQETNACMYVSGYHDDYVGWIVGASIGEEDVPMPGWPVQFALNENGYSPRLTVTVPENCVVNYGEDFEKTL